MAKISALLDESRAARTAEVELVEKSREQLVIEMDKMAQSLKETRDHLAETEVWHHPHLKRCALRIPTLRVELRGINGTVEVAGRVVENSMRSRCVGVMCSG